MIKRIAGFDVSSTCIGWCLLEWDNQSDTIRYITMGNHKPIKTGNIVERLYDTKLVIQKILEEHKPDLIGVENIIEFMKHKSSAKTVITLAVFNRMVCLASHEYIGRSPELFNVMQIRHGLKLDKELPKKEDMPALVSHHLGITFPYVYKRNGTVADESGDMADGVAVALYYAFVLSGRIKLKIKKPKIKKGKVKNGS
jgi:Holliday junction resolvasome RuvABC endonuclease subunit